MKTPEDFKQQVKLHNITFWKHHECGICNTPIGYVFDNDQVYFSSACGCTSISSPDQLRSWEEIADRYNSIQENSKVNENLKLEEKEFWKF